MQAKIVLRVENFEAWRGLAREHLLRKTPPAALIWMESDDDQQLLFTSDPVPEAAQETSRNGAVKLPRAFTDIASVVALHRDSNRWSLLYRTAWRIQNEERNLLSIETDDDVRALGLMRKAVDQDIHRMRAFVRFRRVLRDGEEQYVAWYRPDHHTLDANERFFVERFGSLRWAILTAERSMIWDLTKIFYGPGVPRAEAPGEDQFEDLWRVYYSSVYNPARMNLNAMRTQLPVRRWEDLPESRTIPELVRQSRGSVDAMRRAQSGSASAFIPQRADLLVLRESIASCRACELCGRATQAVFGEGPRDARIMLVGEQPGDEEDRVGRAFVGPAGQVLDHALRAAGLDRFSIYITNAVKAFSFEERGKRRIHQTPRGAHIATCRPWLEAEIEALRPGWIVCLGATAAQATLGRAVRIQNERGRTLAHSGGANVIVTYHPSAILRAPDEAGRVRFREALIEDLTRANINCENDWRENTPLS